MKIYFPLAILLIIFLNFSCQKNDDCLSTNGISGEWIWVKSFGGIGGWTITPATEQVVKKLRIDDFTFREFENDSLVFEAQYDLQIRQDSFLNTNRYIHFENGAEMAVSIGKTKLELHEMCADCFSHEYERQK